MLSPTIVVFVFLVLLGVGILLISAFATGAVKSSADPIITEKPFAMTEEEKEFEAKYMAAIRQYGDRIVASTASWQEMGGYADAIGASRDALYKNAIRPTRVSGPLGNYCCAPLLMHTGEDGKLTVEVAGRSSFRSCVPCHQVRAWCLGPKHPAQCDSPWCTWRDGQCRAWNRPAAAASIFCDNSQPMVCYDYDTFPRVDPGSVSAPAASPSPAPP